jgi:hypothetical protein
MIAAQRTIDLIDHPHTPDVVSDAVLETLIEMSDARRMQIWREKTGLSLETLAALFTLYERGAGYRRVRTYGKYEVTRLKREDQERREREAKARDGEQS